jgi:hypothetical protein
MNTNGIVAVDEAGVIAYGWHSHSGAIFGSGFIVNGVIATRPIYHFANPKVPIPAGWSCELLAVKDGKPCFVAASPSISSVQCVLQNTLNVLGWDLAPHVSVQQPRFGASHYPSRRPMVESSFSDAVIEQVERRGLAVERVSPGEPEVGSCHAIQITDDGTLHGAADPRRLGRAAGY